MIVIIISGQTGEMWQFKLITFTKIAEHHATPNIAQFVLDHFYKE